MRANLILASLTLVLSCPLPGLADTRQLGAHEHGHGRLDIAVEGGTVQLELVAPGDDLVGFEHAPSTPEQTAAIDKAKAILADPIALLGIPAAAGCTLAKAQIETRPEGEEPAEETTTGAAAPAETGEHSEFHASYTLECASPKALTGLKPSYFRAFAGAKELDVSLIAGGGQNKYEATAEAPDVDFGGLVQ